MYFTTTMSITLVLFLVGIVTIMTLTTHRLVEQARHNLTITAVLVPDADSAIIARAEKVISLSPYCYDYRYISRQQALEEHIQALGENPQDFLGYNPLSASFEIQIHSSYANRDSINVIESHLNSLPYINQVIYQRDVLDLLEHNVNQVTIMLAFLAIILLIITYVLIINTVRLHVYSKRFIINTMRLVGATPWVIKKPFLKRNVRMGFEAGLIAIVLLTLAVWYVQYKLQIVLILPTWQNILIVCAIVLFTGELLTLVGSAIAVNRYIRMNAERMYTI